MLALAALLSLAIGVVLGLLGGGGSILTLPMLVYVLGIDTRVSIPSSLVVVGATAAVSALAHARAGRVNARVGLIFGGSGMGGAWLGGYLGQFLSPWVLLSLFGVLMVSTAGAMLRGRPQLAATAPPSAPKAAIVGLLVGALAGLVGAGGGFLIVPALVLLAGLDMAEGVGTSLFVIALQSAAGLAGHITHVSLDWGLLAVITAASITGSLAGARLGRRVKPEALRQAFAWLVLAMGLFVIGKQVPPEVLPPVGVAAAGVLLLSLAGGAVWLRSRAPRTAAH